MDFMHPGCEPMSVAVPGVGLSVAIEDLLRDFATYLRDERSLAIRTTDAYLYHIRVFATWYVEHCGSDLGAVTIAEVNQFLIGRLTDWSAASVRAVRTALRALFGWLFLIGHLDRNLNEGIIACRSTPRADRASQSLTSGGCCIPADRRHVGSGPGNHPSLGTPWAAVQ